ncbi:MAG: cupin domain-containing protein [Phenylobacterium sp.]|nr:cupin domain-containing protein [Phenylobacterium sp.]MBP8246224.1 cupin domain-containing protein [Phenylobacterium sp.]
MNKIDGRYDITKDVLFAGAQAFDVGAVAAVQTPWWNRTLCTVNDSVVRLAVIEGEFHWHRHDEEDEFFYVVEGRLGLDIEGGESVELTPAQAYVVPRGVVHRTRAEGRTVILMVEQASVVPTGD